MMLDADSSALIEAKQRPDCAKFGATSAFCGAYFVPVSFVARDWKVTPAPHPCAADCRTLGRPFNGQRLLGGALPLPVRPWHTWPRFKASPAAAQAGTEHSIYFKNTLTGDRKIMNMPKLGTVIQSNLALENLQNLLKQRASGLMRYTLCEYRSKAKRNSLLNGFDFGTSPHGLLPIYHCRNRKHSLDFLQSRF